jgi:Fur family zinc uptake transcriptional regulator
MSPVPKEMDVGNKQKSRPNETIRGNDAEVLKVLRSAKSAMTAYQILAEAGSTQITAPTTVYRSLTRLIEKGLVHRLESMNAYLACNEHDHLHGPAVFAICRDCGHVDELCDADTFEHLAADARRVGFQVDATVIELSGRCSSCVGLSGPTQRL